MQNKGVIELVFLGLLIIAAAVLAYIVFVPYWVPIFLAIVAAVVFYPVHMKMLHFCREHSTIAAMLSTLVAVAVMLIPLVILATTITQESIELYGRIVSQNGEGLGFFDIATRSIQNFITTFVPNASGFVQGIDIQSYARDILGFISNNLSTVFTGVFDSILKVFIWILALYFFFKDGDKIIKSVVSFSPLEDDFDKKILNKVHTALNSVLKGQLVVGLVQGLLTGIGFAIFGVPSPVVWGVVAAISALLPTIGTGLVIAPAILFLFFTGELTSAIGLLVWGVVIVGLVDNFLGPKLMERGFKVHPLLILLSVLGGIGAFGPVGFLAGPVILALLFVLLDIYPVVINRALSKKAN